MSGDFKNYIDEKWVPAASRATFASLNPANKTEVLGVFPRSDHRDVDRAAESARGHAAGWRATPARRRAGILLRAAELLRNEQDDLARLVTREVGKLLRESAAEIHDTIQRIAQIAGEEGRSVGAAGAPEHPGRLAAIIREPVGVVAAITPLDDPLATPAGTLAAALMAGNSVVLKPAEEAASVATRLIEIVLEAGLPPGVVSLVHGAGDEAAAPLVRHPDVAMVAFTGSAAAGREVAIACAADHKPASLAIGGGNSLVVLDDGDLGLALEAALEGAFATAGQRCTSLGRLILHKKIAREFTERLVARAGALRLGDGLQATTDVGPLISEARLKRVHAATRLGAKEGARLLCGGEALREGELRRGFFYLPTVLGDVRTTMRVAQAEMQGPVVRLLTARDFDEALGMGNGLRPGLVAAVFTRDLERTVAAVRGLHARRIVVNASPLGGEARFAVGGGRAAVDAFTRWKAVVVEAGGRLQGDPAA